MEIHAKLVRIAVNLKKAGFTAPKIADFLEVSPHTVSEYLAETGEGRKHSSPSIREDALEVLSKGASRSEVAQKFGVHVSSISNWRNASISSSKNSETKA